MPKEVINYLCVHCSLSFKSKDACETHEKQHKHAFNPQIKYGSNCVYPDQITLEFENGGRITYHALEVDPEAQILLQKKIK